MKKARAALAAAVGLTLTTTGALAASSAISTLAQDHAAVVGWLDEWVYGLENFAAYVGKIGQTHFDKLKPEPYPAPSVDYGRYR